MKTYQIRNKDTLEVLTMATGKRVFNTTGAAKNSFNNIGNLYSLHQQRILDKIEYIDRKGGIQTRYTKFDEQGVFEIVAVEDEAISLLKRYLKGNDDTLYDDVVALISRKEN